MFDQRLETNVSLVAFYGDKPTELVNLIKRLQSCLASHRLTQHHFVPYQLKQVHGTIIGCEGLNQKSRVVSKWFYERRKETKYINFSGLLDYLQHQINFPLIIRFGGYDRTYKYNFSSRNQHLYVRSFQLQPTDNQTVPILIGWTWNHNSVTLDIDNLRRDLQQFNLLHKYHATSDAVDNDFYLRLGTINTQLTSTVINAISTDMRHLLETQPALLVPIKLENLAFVQYQDLLLSPATTKVISVSKSNNLKLEQLYSAGDLFS